MRKELLLLLFLASCDGIPAVAEECDCLRTNAPCYDYGFKARHDAKCAAEINWDRIYYLPQGKSRIFIKPEVKPY